MSDSTQLALVLLNGAVGGALTVLVAYFFERFTRQILAAVLLIAALFYIAFALRGGAGSLWLAAELIGVLLYGGMAVRGVRGSPWWLVAGWALHPVWDIALHHAGPGRAFAPESYTIPCLSWDLVVAAVVAYRIVRKPRPAIAAASSGAAPGR
jgi:hypothetical protein